MTCHCITINLSRKETVLAITNIHVFTSSRKYTNKNTKTKKDKSFEDSLKKEYPDASRATILECDDENCVQVQCELQPDGSWKCEDGLDASDGKATSKTVLMTSENDD